MHRARSSNWVLVGVVYIALAVATLAAMPAAAQAPVVLDGTLPTCVPADDNALVSLDVQPEAGWSSVRVYFRKNGEEPWYFIEMRAIGGGSYWAVIPKPEADTEDVDFRFVVRDENGVETAGALTTVPVTSSCQIELSLEQDRFANNLVVGETIIEQEGREVVGFQCDGIISRLEPDDELRPDMYCRKVLLAALGPPKSRLLMLLPLIFTFDEGGGGGVVGGGEPGEVSPANP